ncbi:MAG: acetyl-CoA carboxylase biotin carboxyl carrier protein subunit [Candidatus Kapaibacteriota bacterium]
MKKLLVTVNGVTYEVEVELIEEEDTLENVKEVIPQVSKTTIATPSDQPTQTYTRPTAAPTTTMTDNILRSPMNGKIMNIKISPGDVVKKGQVVIELEAMKMKTNIFAPIDGKVKTILVSTGTLVESGQKLLEFE